MAGRSYAEGSNQARSWTGRKKIATVLIVIVAVAVPFGYFAFQMAVPDQVNDLVVYEAHATNASLAWTAPGVSGLLGSVAAYDIRRSDSGPIDQQTWGNAVQIQNPPTPSQAGTKQMATVKDLVSGKTYYFALRSVSWVSKNSAVSNVAIVVTGGFERRFDVNLTNSAPSALISPTVQNGPFEVSSNASGTSHCSLRIVTLTLIDSECPHFRYEYLERRQISFQGTISLTLSLGANETSIRISVIFRASVAFTATVSTNVIDQGESSSVVLRGVYAISHEIASSVTIYNQRIPLSPTKIRYVNATGTSWIWVNVTASFTVKHTLTINDLTVIEGDCRGVVVSHYRWSEERIQFRFSLALEISNGTASAQVDVSTSS